MTTKNNVKETVESETQNILQRITHHLILYGNFCQYQGLLKGKMGIAIFFYELYRATGKKYYNEYADNLIDDIYENMSLYTSLFFNDGIAGIGWGFEYIIRNKYVEANADDILENLDKQIMERNVKVITNIDLDKGLKGIAYYTIARCANKRKYALGRDYIIDLYNSLNKHIPAHDSEGLLLKNQLKAILEQQDKWLNPLFLLKTIVQNLATDKEFVFDKNKQLGIIENGYAGLGLKLLWS